MAALGRGRPERRLCWEILDAAVGLLGCDGGSFQVADEDRPGLRLVACRGLDRASAAFWDFVGGGSTSVCGMALAATGRVIVADVEAEPAFSGSESLREFRRSKLRAIQSTPLLTGDGRLAGMLSTYWHVPHEPSRAELRLIDLVASLANPLQLTRRCAWCGRIEIDGEFRPQPRFPHGEPALLLRRASHGICPDCLARELQTAAAVRTARTHPHALTETDGDREKSPETVESDEPGPSEEPGGSVQPRPLAR